MVEESCIGYEYSKTMHKNWKFNQPKLNLFAVIGCIISSLKLPSKFVCNVILLMVGCHYM